MAWSWSHTNEAYAAARVQLGRLKKGELNVIFAEWKWHFYKQRIEVLENKAFAEDRILDLPYKWEAVYDHWLKRTRKIPHDILVDQIWDWMEDLATCDNGGFNAWCCPHGCHEVPFDFPKGWRPE